MMQLPGSQQDSYFLSILAKLLSKRNKTFPKQQYIWSLIPYNFSGAQTPSWTPPCSHYRTSKLFSTPSPTAMSSLPFCNKLLMNDQSLVIFLSVLALLVRRVSSTEACFATGVPVLHGASQAAAAGFGGREEVCICCFHQGTAQTERLEKQSSRLFLGCG